MKNILSLILFFFLIGSFSYSQTRVIPAPAQSQPILLKGGVAHLGDGRAIQNAAIGFAEGKITLVVDASTAKIDESGYQVIDISGKHVYPGFILVNSNLGLVETSSIADTRDFAETGELNPSVRSIIAYNTDSELIPSMRYMGILIAQATPSSGIISGSSSIVQLDAWNWEDASFKEDDAIHMNWPVKMRPPRFFLGETQGRPNPNYEKSVDAIEQLFSDALAYQKEETRKINLKLEAMLPLFEGGKALHIHTDDAKSIINACKTAQKYGVKRIAVIGGEEALLVKDFLKSHKIPVVLTNIHSLPSRDHEDTVFPYKLPKMLQDAGLDFCITNSSDMTARQRNLPFTAGTAVAYGLGYEDAVKAITLDAARILGISDRTGSLEEGKDATLFVSTGDALDMRSNNVEHAFIQGRQIQINARQQFLYEKYSDKYGHKVYLQKEKN